MWNNARIKVCIKYLKLNNVKINKNIYKVSNVYDQGYFQLHLLFNAFYYTNDAFSIAIKCCGICTKVRIKLLKGKKCNMLS